MTGATIVTNASPLRHVRTTGAATAKSILMPYACLYRSIAGPAFHESQRRFPVRLLNEEKVVVHLKIGASATIFRSPLVSQLTTAHPANRR